ncbi:MAG: tetratricopeptide repeat protein [Endomicrobium sp.]|nr:tetratricopeptide repeat protein [Endomicrobium sp.]
MKIKPAVFILGFVFLLQSENLFTANYEAYKFFLQGIFSLKKWHISTAIKNYEKVIALDKDAIAAYKDLIYLYWLSGNNEKALQTIEKLSEFDGENFKTTNFLAVIYFTAGEFDVAKQFWKKTIELNPKNKTATVCLATYYSDNKSNDAASVCRDFNLAKKECEKHIPTCPDSMFKLAYMGQCCYQIDDYKKTEEIFLKIRKRFPLSRVGTYQLGVTYKNTGYIDKAITEFEKFEKLTPKKEKDSSVFKELGHCYSILKDYSKSEKNLLKALDLEPLDIVILELTALNYINWKKYGKAIECFNKITELMPNFADAYFYLGQVYYDKNKDFENAEKVLLKAIKINPDYSEAMNYLGHIYVDKGIKLNEAEVLLTKSIALKPKNAIYIDSLGWLYYKQGKFDDAKRLLLSIVDTRYPPIFDHLGDTFVALDRIIEAWTSYALSYDIKQNKNVKKKLDSVQIKIPQKEVYRQMLLRSKGHYNRMPSFKTGYKAKLNSKFSSKSIYIPFFYVKNGNIKIYLPDVLIQGGCSISIKNKQTEILPKAIESKIPYTLTNIIAQVCKIFNGSFYKQFTDAKVVRNKNKIIYSKDNTELILNADTALIERFSQNNITVNILKYDNLYGSKIPSKIEFSFPDMKIKGILEATKVSPLVSAEKE